MCLYLRQDQLLKFTEMIKGLRYLGKDKDGNDILEEYDCPEMPIVNPDYEQTVEMLIREKYSLNDELAIANNRMAVFDANLLPKEKEDEYNREYYTYQLFREECKKKARKICGITK